jgi:hypothetical protein
VQQGALQAGLLCLDSTVTLLILLVLKRLCFVCFTYRAAAITATTTATHHQRAETGCWCWLDSQVQP